MAIGFQGDICGQRYLERYTCMRFLISGLLCVLLFRSVDARAAVFISGQVEIPGGKTPPPSLGVSLYSSDESDLLPGDAEAEIASARTLPNGTFVLKAAEAGTYRLVVLQDGYVPVNQQIYAPHAGLSDLEIPLRPVPSLQLKLVGIDGKPMTSGNVEGWVWLQWGDRGARVLPLAPTGFAAIPGDSILRIQAPVDLPVHDISRIMVELQAPGIGIAQTEMDRWEEDPVPMQFQTGAVLNGLVSDATGKPVEKATVAAVRILPDGSPIEFLAQAIPGEVKTFPAGVPTAVTDAVGRFSIPHLFRDHYLAAVIYPGGETQAFQVNITGERAAAAFSLGDRRSIVHPLSLPRAGGPLLATLPLRPLVERLDPSSVDREVNLSGKIVQKDTPVPNAIVSLQTLSLFQPFGSTISAADGSYNLKCLPGRSYWLRVDDGKNLVTQRRITAGARGDSSLDFPLKPVPTAAVRVMGADGKPAANPAVLFYEVVNWGSATVDATWQGAIAADGSAPFSAPRWAVPAGETSVDDPTDILIAVRDPVQGFGETHLDRWPDAPVEIQLGPALSVTGTVLDPDGKPVPAAPVYLFRSAFVPGAGTLPSIPVSIGVVSNAAGHFEIPAIPPGTYSLDAVYKGLRFRVEALYLKDKPIDVTVHSPVVK